MDIDTKAATEEAVKHLSGLVAEYAISVLGAIAILIFGFTLASLIARWVRNTMLSVNAVDITLATFIANAIKYVIWVLVLITVLAQFGVQTTSIIAALGAAGLAIGLALQGTLANIAAGIMLLILRPFRVGEYIEAGSTTGTVQEIGLFTTELKKPDGLFVMTPNNQLWNASIINYSRHPLRRFELIVGIGYDDSMEKAKDLLLELAEKDERVLKTPSPVVFIRSLDDSSVAVGLRVWTKTDDYFAVSWDLTESVKSRFDDAGISIPFPQRDIHQKS